MKARKPGVEVERYAGMMAALGAGLRLRIVRLLLSAHADGLVVKEIQAELGIPPSTLSHHLDELRKAGLVTVQREGSFLRYAAHTGALRELLGFLYAECCTRSKAARPGSVVLPVRERRLGT